MMEQIVQSHPALKQYQGQHNINKWCHDIWQNDSWLNDSWLNDSWLNKTVGTTTVGTRTVVSMRQLSQFHLSQYDRCINSIFPNMTVDDSKSICPIITVGTIPFNTTVCTIPFILTWQLSNRSQLYFSVLYFTVMFCPVIYCTVPCVISLPSNSQIKI